jgi:hypothetical protein
MPCELDVSSPQNDPAPADHAHLTSLSTGFPTCADSATGAEGNGPKPISLPPVTCNDGGGVVVWGRVWVVINRRHFKLQVSEAMQD